MAWPEFPSPPFPGHAIPLPAAQDGASAFLPYLPHLIGQPPSGGAAAGAAAGGSSTGGGSGILGCLHSKDWAARRAAADALTAAALLLGPALEPEGAWGVGDASSLTGRCVAALEAARFDKVRGPRGQLERRFRKGMRAHASVCGGLCTAIMLLAPMLLASVLAGHLCGAAGARAPLPACRLVRLRWDAC
jgi:hypothetical protein